MADPSRDLPRIINFAMCVAISSFVLLNFSLFLVVGFQGVRGRSIVAVVSLSRFPHNMLREKQGNLIYNRKGFRCPLNRIYRQSHLFHRGLTVMSGFTERQRIRKWTTHGRCERKSLYASNS